MIKKIKGWFSKRSKAIEVNNPNKLGNLNGLYVPRNDDIKKIADKLNDVEDALNNLPAIPDHSDFATKSGDNRFTGNNTFAKKLSLETFPEISKGNFEPSLNKQLTPKFYVDKKVNDTATTINQNITTAAEGAVRDAKTYTDEKHAQQATEINRVYTVAAKTASTNLFEGENTFNQLTTMNTLRVNGNSEFNRAVTYRGQVPKCGIAPSENEHLTNKEYVDNKVKQYVDSRVKTTPFMGGYVYVLSSSELGFYTSGSIRCYYMRLTQRNVQISNPKIVSGKYYSVMATIRLEGNSSESWKQTNIARCYTGIRASGNVITLPVLNRPEPNITFVWPTDWGNPFKLVWDCLIIEE